MTMCKCLRCVKEIPSCPALRVGDVLYKTSHEIWDGGYEYVVCKRIYDGVTMKFRESRIEECFEITEVPLRTVRHLCMNGVSR